MMIVLVEVVLEVLPGKPQAVTKQMVIKVATIESKRDINIVLHKIKFVLIMNLKCVTLITKRKRQ